MLGYYFKLFCRVFCSSIKYLFLSLQSIFEQSKTGPSDADYQIRNIFPRPRHVAEEPLEVWASFCVV